MHATLVFGLALGVAAPGLKDAPKKDPTILGEWVFESGMMGGMAVPTDKAKLRVTFRTDGIVTARDGDQPTKEEHTYTIDAKKTPAEIDLVPRNKGNNQGIAMSATGIFKIEDDTLTICFSIDGTRPKAFASPAGEMTILMTFKRARKD
jgi:uncharacterized protein (TIGR03067 family)